MNWYLQRGKDSDVVKSVKITFFRNLRNFKFETKNHKEIQEIEDLVKLNIPSVGYNLKFLKLNNMDLIGKKAIIEKGLINETLLEDDKTSMLINDEENICILVNSQNHIELQVFNSGMELENTYNLSKEIDEKLDKTFDIAKNKKYGYLTTSPINVGTGLRGEIIVHLPGLTKTGNIRKISQSVNNFGLDFNGIYIENQQVIGDLYQISNKQTLGITEETIINNLKVIVEKIIEQERKARKLLAQNQVELEDIIYRKYGILTNARRLTWQEAIELISEIKMGADLGILNELTDNQIAKIYFYIQPANLQVFFGQNLENYEGEIKRAEMIKQIINEK